MRAPKNVALGYDIGKISVDCLVYKLSCSFIAYANAGWIADVALALLLVESINPLIADPVKALQGTILV